MNNIYITLDTDWAPQEVINYTLDLLKEYSITATIFCTNDKPEIKGNHEIGIHPNFLKRNQEVKRLVNHYEHVKGSRSHSLLTSGYHSLMLKKEGIEYESNFLMYKKENITPLKWFGTVMLPIYFQDDFYLRYDRNNFSIEELNLETDGIKIFNFHPVHLFLNTPTMEHYEKAKKHYKEPKLLKKYVNNKERGIRDLFTELISKIKKENIETKKLGDIYNNYLKA